MTTFALGVHPFVTLAPSGFGTGYYLSKNKKGDARKGSPELARFFGLEEIFVTEFDHD